MVERRVLCVLVALVLAGTVAFAGGVKEGESGKAQRLEVRLTKILVPDNGGWKITDGL